MMARIARLLFTLILLFHGGTAVPGWSQESVFFQPEGLAAPGETTPYSAQIPPFPKVALRSPPEQRSGSAPVAPSEVSAGPSEEVRRADAPKEASIDTPKEAKRIPLARPDGDKGDLPPFSSSRSFLASLISLLGSLIFVIGVFLLVAYGLKRIAPAQNHPLPSRVLHCVGQYSLTSRNRFYLLQFGAKLLLVSVSGDETSLICEVSEEKEVAAIMSELGQERTSSRSGRST